MSQDLFEAIKTKPTKYQQKVSNHRTKTMSVKPCKEVEALKNMLFNSPEVNQEKIEFIKSELSAGRYQINCQNIADKMLENI